MSDIDNSESASILNGDAVYNEEQEEQMQQAIRDSFDFDNIEQLENFGHNTDVDDGQNTDMDDQDGNNEDNDNINNDDDAGDADGENDNDDEEENEESEDVVSEEENEAVQKQCIVVGCNNISNCADCEMCDSHITFKMEEDELLEVIIFEKKNRNIKELSSFLKMRGRGLLCR